MRAQLEQRLLELRAEFEGGQKIMADLEIKHAKVRDSLLRISGAIQALEELLDQKPEGVSDVESPGEREMQPLMPGL